LRRNKYTWKAPKIKPLPRASPWKNIVRGGNKRTKTPSSVLPLEEKENKN